MLTAYVTALPPSSLPTGSMVLGVDAGQLGLMALAAVIALGVATFVQHAREWSRAPRPTLRVLGGDATVLRRVA